MQVKGRRNVSVRKFLFSCLLGTVFGLDTSDRSFIKADQSVEVSGKAEIGRRREIDSDVGEKMTDCLEVPSQMRLRYHLWSRH